jgi:hypothetical protein
MLSKEAIEGLAKEAVKRQLGRTGRSFKGEDNIRRELHAAGETRQNHGVAISYPKGTPVKPDFSKEAGILRLSYLLDVEEAPRQLGVL